jgi:titin
MSCDQSRLLAPNTDTPDLATIGTGGLSDPSGLVATAVSTTQIDLVWQDNSSNESGFEVHRSTTGPTGVFTLHTSTQPSVATYSDVGINHSTQYCYKVRAFRITGRKTSYSQFSTSACATTPAPPPPPPPAAPSAADAWPQYSSSVVVTWSDNSPNENGFRVERSLDAGTSWSAAATQEWASYIDHGLASEHPVCYRVIAFNAGGESPPSNTDCTIPPAEPNNLTATVTHDPATDEWVAELAWTDNSAVEDGYEVRIYQCCSGLWNFVSLPPNSTTFRYVVLDPEEYIEVVAKRDGGNSDFATFTVTRP